MTDEVLYLLPDDSTYSAAREMKSPDVGIVKICNEDQRLLGVVTDRDIVLRVVAEGKRPGEVPLKAIATMDPISAQRNWEVVENGRLIGYRLARWYCRTRLPGRGGGSTGRDQPAGQAETW